MQGVHLCYITLINMHRVSSFVGAIQFMVQESKSKQLNIEVIN